MGCRLTARVLSALARLVLLSCLGVIALAGCAAGAALVKPAAGGPIAASHASQSAALLAGHPSGGAASSTYDSLSGVSCSSATSCVSVGGDEDTGLAVAELWNGKAWTATSVPLPAKMHYDGLFDVSWPTTSECIAVGDTTGKAPYELAERWNAKAWSVVPAPGLMGATFGGISCTAASSCMVVGETSVGGSGGGARAIAYSWNGTSWTSTDPVELSGVSFVSLNDVSCTRSTYCVVVGDAGETGGGAAVTTALHWNGKSWSSVPSPNPDERSQLGSVACVTSADCYAVGTISKSDFGTPWLSLVEHWNGRTWSVVASPSTNFATFLNDVACAGPTTCFAVGSNGGETGGSATLVEQWNGSHWTIEASPNP